MCKLGGALAVGVGGFGAFSSLAACRAAVPEPAKFDFAPHPPLNLIENHFQFHALKPRYATRQIVVHHTGIGGNNDLCAMDIHRMHLRNGWSGIGYHLFVRRDGLAETGRPLDQIGAHAYGHNQTTIGICLAGNFDRETPTDGQLASAAELIAMLCRLYGLKPNGGAIVGHRDLDPTDCPGALFYPHLYSLRERAAKVLDEDKQDFAHNLPKTEKTERR